MSRNQNPILVQSDPLRIAWTVLGQQMQPTSEATLVASCGRCSQIEPLTPFRSILSNNFTGWGAVDPSSSGLCDSCAWGYRDERLRTLSVVVSNKGEAVFATQTQLKGLLSLSLSPDIAVSIPYSGKKHILPHAEWGKVVGDDGALSWRSTEAELIEVLLRLRAFRVYESELMEPAPPYRAVSLVALDTDKMIELLDLWERLRPWQRSPHLKIGVRSTREDYIGTPLTQEVEVGDSNDSE